MPGPYFKDQEPAPCGCYYPDVCRLRDITTTQGHIVIRERVLWCVVHGEYKVPLADDLNPFPPMFDNEPPTTEWLETERERVRKQQRERHFRRD